jgi:hypothetical protein
MCKWVKDKNPTLLQVKIARYKYIYPLHVRHNSIRDFDKFPIAWILQD